jgi:hypothetical protein
MTNRPRGNAGAMLSFPNMRQHQIAYVTTNLDEALKRIDEAFELERYYFINTAETPNHPNQPPLRIALVRTAGTELEVIEPLGPGAEVWSDPLPKDGSFGLQFHHFATTVHGSRQDFERYRATWDEAKHPIVVDGWAGDDARWFYTDERATLGHFIEHCWFSDALTSYLAGLVPKLS